MALTWLANALGDLEAAQGSPRGWVPARTVAFHSQQAAEKALKAALILSGEPTAKIHDLDALRNRLPDGWRVTKRYPDLSRLTDYAVDSRYPESIQPVTRAESSNAVRQAKGIVKAIREDFERRGVSTEGLKPQ